MGRAPCCDKANVKKGPWSPEEDAKLKAYIDLRGTGGNWIALPQKIGLKRCGKSCRLRWLNYLRPNIKHGGFSEEEDNIICSLYVSIGSRWSIIAAQLPGRTDNDIKNYWNTRLKKKLLGKQRKEQQQARRKQSDDQITKREYHTAANSAPPPCWPHSAVTSNASLQYYDLISNQTPLAMRTVLNQLPYFNTITTSSRDTFPQYPTTISINAATSQPSNDNTLQLQGFDENFPNDNLLGSIMQASFYGMESAVDMGGSTNTASTESNNSNNWGDMSSFVNLVSSDYDEGCPQHQGFPLQDAAAASASASASAFDDSRYFGMMQMQ